MRRAAFQKLLELARQDERVLFVASDIAEGPVADFRREFPERIFMEGIAEQHLIGMSCGLAKCGGIVFVNTIASFLSRRCLDQIAINLCLEKANVKLLSQGGGLVYGRQGPTHHANEDIALMRALPNMTVIVPCDTEQTKRALEFAHRHEGPVYIRLAKGNVEVVSQGQSLDPELPIVHRKPGRIVILATGTMTQTALAVANRLEDCGVIGVPFMKPFPQKAIAEAIKEAELVVTIEEHSEIGGLGSCVCETMVRHRISKPAFMSFALKDEFVHEYGEEEDLCRLNGLHPDPIHLEILRHLRGTPDATT